MAPRFVMIYPDQNIVDDGEDVELRWMVPRVWLDAPADGMQAVIKHRPDGKIQVVESLDIYSVMQNGEPMGTNDLSPMLRSIGLIKNGLWIPDVEFENVRSRIRQYRKEHERRR